MTVYKTDKSQQDWINLCEKEFHYAIIMRTNDDELNYIIQISSRRVKIISK